MCYSEELKRDLNAYRTTAGWVMVGVKAVLRAKEGYVSLRTFDPAGYGYGFDVVGAQTAARLNRDGHYVYSFGIPVRDEHGFHLGASTRGAIKAMLNFYKPDLVRISCPECTMPIWNRPFNNVVDQPCRHAPHNYRPRAEQARNAWNGRYTFARVLVPESAIEDNHAHVATMIEPGLRETEQQIMDVAKAALRWKGRYAQAKADLDQRMILQWQETMMILQWQETIRTMSLEKLSAMNDKINLGPFPAIVIDDPALDPVKKEAASGSAT